MHRMTKPFCNHYGPRAGDASGKGAAESADLPLSPDRPERTGAHHLPSFESGKRPPHGVCLCKEGGGVSSRHNESGGGVEG